MKTMFSILAIALAGAAVPAMSQQLKLEESTTAASAPGRADMARTVRASATVTDVDKATRTVTLKDTDGKEFTVVAGPEVSNFDQINLGFFCEAECLGQLHDPECLAFDSGQADFRGADFTVDPVRAILSDGWLLLVSK